MKSVALLAAVWIGLNALCVWLVANNKMQGWDLYAILFALVLAIAVSIVIVWRLMTPALKLLRWLLAGVGERGGRS